MDLTKDTSVSDAKTLSEINIHLGYMGKRIDANNEERKKDLLDIKDGLKELKDNQVSRAEFETLEKTVKSHTDDLKILVQFKDTLNGKLWGVGASAGAVVAFVNIIINAFLK